MGDFNSPDIEWNILSSIINRSSVFVNCILCNFLSQMVQELTRHAALLDLILTNDENTVNDIEVRETLGASGHYIIRFNWNMRSGPKLQVNREKISDLRNRDLSKFRAMLNEIDWEKEFNGQNCFIMWE